MTELTDVTESFHNLTDAQMEQVAEYYAKRPTDGHVSQFWETYYEYLGSYVDARGNYRSTPMTSRDAYRAAVDYYRKHLSREVSVSTNTSVQDDSAGDYFESAATPDGDMFSSMLNAPSPEDVVSFNNLVRSMLNMLAADDEEEMRSRKLLVIHVRRLKLDHLLDDDLRAVCDEVIPEWESDDPSADVHMAALAGCKVRGNGRTGSDFNTTKWYLEHAASSCVGHDMDAEGHWWWEGNRVVYDR